MDNVLYRKVMRVLEGAGVPAPVRANVDSIFHGSDPAATTTYNPDDYEPGQQYTPWVEAGSPTHDVKGRELDVRGQLTGGEFSPYPNPNPPPGGTDGGSGTSDRSPDFSDLTNPAGLWNAGCQWRNGWSSPSEAPHTQVYSVPEGAQPFPLAVLRNDNPNGDVTVAIGPLGGEKQSYANGDSVPVTPGSYEIIATCMDTPNTREHGAAANISFSNGA